MAFFAPALCPSEGCRHAAAALLATVQSIGLSDSDSVSSGGGAAQRWVGLQVADSLAVDVDVGRPVGVAHAPLQPAALGGGQLAQRLEQRRVERAADADRLRPTCGGLDA